MKHTIFIAFVTGLTFLLHHCTNQNTDQNNQRATTNIAETEEFVSTKEISGTVLLNDSPIQGATVTYNSERYNFYFESLNMAFQSIGEQKDLNTAVTDSSGAFMLNGVIDEPFTLCAVHDELGFAVLPDFEFEKNNTIQLKPWVRIEGRLLFDENSIPYNEADFAVTPPFPMKEFFDWYARNNSTRNGSLELDEGKFVVEKVPADSLAMLFQANPFSVYSHYFLTPENRSKTINLNRTTIHITGKLTIENYKYWKFDNQELTLYRHEPELSRHITDHFVKLQVHLFYRFLHPVDLLGAHFDPLRPLTPITPQGSHLLMRTKRGR